MPQIRGADIKVVGKSGQISLGKNYAGKALRVEHRRDGAIVLTAVAVMQQGDVVGLVEKAQEAFDQGEAERLSKKVAKEGKFDLEDFLSVMRQMQKMGPLEGLLKMLPGVNTAMLKQANMDPKRMKHVEAIILSMTRQERARPDVLNGSRRLRIAKGAGRTVAEVNRLVDQFKQMQKMMKSLRGMGSGMGRMMPRLPGLR